MDKSHRAAAGWLLSYASFGENLAAADGPWDKMIEAEESVLQASPEATTREIVVACGACSGARLKKLGRNDNALAAMRRLIGLDNGDAGTLVETLQWLIEQQAWKVVDEAADRFAAVIAGDAVLSYAVAEAQLAQGRKSREELAAQALKLNAGKEIHAVYGHFAAAMSLQKRGLFAWAEKEYRYIMAVNAAVMPLAAYRLAEMEHDQGDNLAAAEVLQTAVTAAAANRPAPNSPRPIRPPAFPSARSEIDIFPAIGKPRATWSSGSTWKRPWRKIPRTSTS